MLELPGKIRVDDVIQPVLGQRLLFRAHAHFEQKFNGPDPFLVVPDEGIIFNGVPGALYVHIF